jgi:glycosyltransferase involved in cell wall biosynthesis
MKKYPIKKIDKNISKNNLKDVIDKIEFKQYFLKNILFINFTCSFKDITDNYNLRIFSKKTLSSDTEIRDPHFFQSNYCFEIHKKFSFIKKTFLFKIDTTDDLHYLKIGLVKEGDFWFDETCRINIKYNDLTLLLNNIYLNTLRRNIDESGLENFLNLIKNNQILISNIPSIIKNSEEYLMLSAKNLKNIKRKEVEDIDIIIECPANRCDGYGNSAHYFSENLSQKKKLRIIPTINTGDVSDLFSSLIIDKVDYKKYNPNHYLFFHIPRPTPLPLDSNIKKYILTMFESTKIPSSWPNAINSQFNKLIVPSEFCKDIFIDNGIKINTEVINLGVDPELWPFYNRNFDKKIFNFLLFANAHWENTRKNYQLTLDAFIKAFGNNPNVNLIVKLTAKTNKFDNFKYKNVKFIFEKYNHKQMLNLVNSSDCMVFVSNGEGFGLPPREAMSTGMPVILMNWSSLSEICKKDISYWINPISLQPAIYPKEFCNINGGSHDFGEFAKGSSDQLAEIMRYVYSNKDEAYSKGLAASKYIREYETYDIATNKLISIMEAE